MLLNDNHKSCDAEKNGSINDRPLFMQNGNRRFSTSVDTEEISNFRRSLPQFLAVSVKNILLFAYGMTLGFPTIVIPAIQGGEGREQNTDSIVLNREQISWFSSINLICVPLGCIFSGLLTQPIGKKRAMQIVNLPMIASWLLFHFATKTEHLYAALCLSGLGGGLMEAPVLTYVAEVTEPKYRGILSALGSTCVITGVFVQFILGSLTDWRTIAAVSSVFPVISMIALCFIPESPTWLIREQRFREAVKALQWLRGWVPEYMIESEFNRLYNELIVKPAQEEEAENHGNKKPSYIVSRLRLFRKRSFVVPFLIVTFSFFAGHFSGKTPLQTYAVQIFHTLKAPINKYHATIILGVAELLATIISVFLIHFTGKRPLVFVSTLGVACCMFGTATYAHYLKIVPGFAINNVVVNASSLVPKESIISQDNITRIFENEEKVLLQQQREQEQEHQQRMLSEETGTATPIIMDSTTMIPTMTENWTIMDDEIEEENSTMRIKRQISSILPLLDSATDNVTGISLDYDIDSLSNTTDLLIDLLDSEEYSEITTEGGGEKVREVSSTVTTAAATTTTSTESPPPKSQPEESDNRRAVDDILIAVPKQQKNYLVWIPLILLLGSAFFAHIGIRMLPWILIGEVFPANVRSTASGLVSGLGYIFGFLANKLFLQMLSTLTLPGTFWFYSSVGLTGFIVLYFTLPETEGRTLGEIEAHFSKKSETNLLSKKWLRENDMKKMNNNDIHNHKAAERADKQNFGLQHLDNLQIPIGPYAEARVIKLQQSDFVHSTSPPLGQINPAFEDAGLATNTTHL